MSLARLKTRRDFLRVAGTRVRAAAPGLILQVRRHDADEAGVAPLRVGFTVSRKVGNAVVRNRVRRRLRAVAAEVLPGAARTGRDFVIVGRREAETRAFTDLLADLDRALARTGAHL